MARGLGATAPFTLENCILKKCSISKELSSLDCLDKQSNNNKESTMYEQYHTAAVAFTQAPVSLERQQRETLVFASESARNKQSEDLRKHFGVSDEDPPKTTGEMVERIKAGEFTIDEDYDPVKAYNYGYGYTYGLRWRKPKTKVDIQGLETALKSLDEAYKHLMLDVVILPLMEGLAAVRAFEEKKFH